MKTAVLEKPAMEAGGVLRRIRRMSMHRRGASSFMHISRILLAKDELELSDDQVKKLRDIRADLVRSLIKLSADLRIARLDSLSTIAAKPVNFEQIRANAKNLANLRMQRKLGVIDAFEKASKVLSSDQKDALADMISGWMDEEEEELPDELV